MLHLCEIWLHLNIKTAYLYCILEEELYMRQSPGFAVSSKKEYVCKLKRSIYGLRQSVQWWQKRLHDVLIKLGFTARVLTSASSKDLEAVTTGLKRFSKLPILGTSAISSA